MNMRKQTLLTAALLAASTMIGSAQAAIMITNEPGHLGFGTGGTNINGGGARSTHTITNFSLNGGNAVVLFFAAEGPSNNNDVSLSATYGGQDMTIVQTVGAGPSVDRFQASIAYIINPNVSTGDIVANWVVSTESIIEAIALSNVGGVVGSASGDDTASTSLNYTTTLDGGFVVGAGINNAFQGGPTSAPNNSGINIDTALFEDNVSANFAAIFAYGDVATAGSYTDTIGGNPSSESAALIAFEAVSAFVPGDTDNDGDLDDSDLGTSLSNYTGPVGDVGKTAAEGDTDGDGDVDDSDLGTSFSNYTGPLSPVSVPEPTSLALLSLGGLWVARRRRA